MKVRNISPDYWRIINSISDVIKLSESVSEYREGLVEGIVIKTSNGRFVDKCFKIVNKHFERTDNFNEVLIKNKLSKSF